MKTIQTKMSCGVDAVRDTLMSFGKFPPHTKVKATFDKVGANSPQINGEMMMGVLDKYKMTIALVSDGIYMPRPYILTNGERWMAIIPVLTANGWFMSYSGKKMEFKKALEDLYEAKYKDGFIIYKIE